MLHGRYDRQTEVKETDLWTWLKEGNIKREIESLIMAPQERHFEQTKSKSKIDKTQKEGNCRMCGTTIETVNHIVSECSKLAQKECRRHDWVV